MRTTCLWLVTLFSYSAIGWGACQFHVGLGPLLVGLLVWLDLFFFTRR
jgi:hypothetical protein